MMMNSYVRRIAALVLLATLAACSGVQATQSAAPTTDVNPITGSRGGSGAR